MATSLFQLEIEEVFKEKSSPFIQKCYGEAIEFKSTYNEFELNVLPSYFENGLYIYVKPNEIIVYKTKDNGEIDYKRKLYGYFEGKSTALSGNRLADTEQEFKLINKYIIMPIYVLLFKNPNKHKLTQILENEEIFRQTGVRKSAYKLLTQNRQELFHYLKGITHDYSIEVGEIYYFAEFEFDYISLKNYKEGISAIYKIINSNGEQLVLLCYSDYSKGVRYVTTENLMDDFLYELKEVLTEMDVGSHFIQVHKKIIRDKLEKNMIYYDDKKLSELKKKELEKTAKRKQQLKKSKKFKGAEFDEELVEINRSRERKSSHGRL